MQSLKQAFIFCAGRGERMRPLSDTIPKPLVLIDKKPMVEHIIEKITEFGEIKKIIVNGFYLADKIENHLKNMHSYNARVIFSREPEKLETGGGLLFAKNLIDINKPLLLVNGDVIWREKFPLDISDLYENFLSNPCKIMLGLTRTDKFECYHDNGDFNFDPATLNLSKPKENNNQKLPFTFTGLQISDPKLLFQDVPESSLGGSDLKYFSMSYFYQNAINENGILEGIKGTELTGRYFHVGTISAIEEAERKMRLDILRR